jgi:hypothetical protein
MSLCAFLLLGCIMPTVHAKGMWGTGTRRKRAAEREFTLPNHLTSDSVPTARSFEELQAEAEAAAGVNTDTFYADQLLNSLNKPSSASKKKNADNAKNNQRNKQNKKRKTHLDEENSVSQQEVETFLTTCFDTLEGQLNAPEFASNMEDFLIQMLSLHYTSVEVDSMRSLLQENGVLTSFAELNQHVGMLRQLIPTFATSIRRDLTPDDVRTLLSLDFSSMSGETVSPEVMDFVKRLLRKYNLDLEQSSGSVKELEKVFSSLQEGKFSPENLMKQFTSAGMIE